MNLIFCEYDFGTHMEIRRQRVWIASLHLPGEPQGSNWGLQAWLQTPLPTEQFCWSMNWFSDVRESLFWGEKKFHLVWKGVRKIVINTSVNVCYNSSVKLCGLVLHFWNEVDSVWCWAQWALYTHSAAELYPQLWSCWDFLFLFLFFTFGFLPNTSTKEV